MPVCLGLGDVAQLCRQTQSLLAPPVALTIRGVYSTLRRIRYDFDSFWYAIVVADRLNEIMYSFQYSNRFSLVFIGFFDSSTRTMPPPLVHCIPASFFFFFFCHAHPFREYQTMFSFFYGKLQSLLFCILSHLYNEVCLR